MGTQKTTTTTTAITIPHIDRRAAAAKLAHCAKDAADALETLGAVTMQEACDDIYSDAYVLTAGSVAASAATHDAIVDACITWDTMSAWDEGNHAAPMPGAIPALLDAIDGALAAYAGTDDTNHWRIVDDALTTVYHRERMFTRGEIRAKGVTQLGVYALTSTLDAAIVVALQALDDARELELVDDSALTCASRCVNTIAEYLDINDEYSRGAMDLAVRMLDDIVAVHDSATMVPLRALLEELDALEADITAA